MDAKARIASIDIYRGFVMLLMMAEVLSFESVSRALPEGYLWHMLAFLQTHVPWTGCSLHDLIQPSFTFLVGVALPYSLASRISKGDSKAKLIVHAIKRSLILIALGIFLRSMYANQTYFTFEDTLTQIGLGYTFLVILGFYKLRVQLIVLVVILVGYWLAFALYPLPDAKFDSLLAGIPADWKYNRDGFAAHWNLNSNFAWAFDNWFLNLFPRESPFVYNYGGYSTLSFVPTLGTMILGLFAGKLMKSNKTPYEKNKFFIIVGISLLLLGVLLHLTGINPIVKRIWTPAWTVFSGGLCFLLLSLFYYVADVRNIKKWAFLFIVIGMNSIVAYVLADCVSAFFVKMLYIHLGRSYDQIFSIAYATLVKGTLLLIIEWLILYWLYKRKIFIKI